MAHTNLPAVTDHPFTPWRTVPRRCNTCGKVEKRHTVVAVSTTDYLLAEAEALVADYDAKYPTPVYTSKPVAETTYRLVWRGYKMRKARTCETFVVTTWSDGKVISDHTFYDLHTQHPLPHSTIDNGAQIGRVVAAWVAKPDHSVVYSHYAIREG